MPFGVSTHTAGKKNQIPSVNTARTPTNPPTVITPRVAFYYPMSSLILSSVFVEYVGRITGSDPLMAFSGGGGGRRSFWLTSGVSSVG